MTGPGPTLSGDPSPSASSAAVPFPGVVGHQSVTASLQRAIDRDQLHHGLIFAGPRGVGKSTLARGLACALHCQEAPALGCGRCNNCRRVLAGTHAGVEWIVPEADSTTIKVAVARELANRLELAPFEGRHHVVIFDPASALTEQAFNALLKTLEEPRSGVHFVMVTTGLDALLPTILSRCLPVRLGPLDGEQIDAVIRRALTERPADAEPVGDDRIALAVRLCEGSAGLAIELALDDSLDDALALLRHAMQAASAGVPGIFGGDRSPLWSTWTQAIGTVRTGRPARERALAGRVLDLWLLHLRECLRGNPGLPGLPAREPDARAILREVDRLQTLREGLERNPNVRLALEQTLLELA